MKIIILILTTLLVITPKLTNSQAINDALRRQIESFRSQMPCGIGDGPPLAPLRHDLFQIDVNTPGFVSHGYLQNILVENLDQFLINNINFNLLQLRIDFSFYFQEIPATGQYYFDSRIFDWVRLWGNGPFRMKATGLDLTGFLRFTLSGGFLNMAEFNATLSLHQIESHIDGVFGGGGVSDFFNRILEEFIPEFVNQHHNEIGQILSDIISPPINAVVNDMTLSDLLDLINSEPGGESEPCIPPT